MPTIPVIPDEAVPSEKGYHNGVHLVIYYHKEYGVDRKDSKVDVDPDIDETEVEDVRLDNERERHWRMIFGENDGGVDD